MSGALTFRKELGIPLDQFTCHGCSSQLAKSVSLLRLIRPHRDLLDLIDGHHRCSPQALDDDL